MRFNRALKIHNPFSTQGSVIHRRHKFRAHRKAQHTIINNERWYHKGQPFLGKSFTVKKTIKRHAKICDILARAAERETRQRKFELASAYHQLHKRIRHCHPGRRCGSSACPKCARAFQRAKVAAQETALLQLSVQRPRKRLVMVTIIPPGMAYTPGHFHHIDLLKANRWLKDVLGRMGITRPVIGTIDLGWESRNGSNYLQLHWHLALWSADPPVLAKKLSLGFQKLLDHHRISKVKTVYKRPTHVKVATDFNFLGYIHKLIKLPKLLRSGKRQLPELLLLLDRWDSLDFLFLRKMRVGAQSDVIVLKPSDK
jgi:hypothetical protein